MRSTTHERVGRGFTLILTLAAIPIYADSARPSSSPIEILSPKNGDKLKPGQEFTVVIQTDPLLPISSVGVLGWPLGVSGDTQEQSPDSLWRLDFRVPTRAIGKSELHSVAIAGEQTQRFLGEVIDIEVDVSHLRLERLEALHERGTFVDVTQTDAILAYGHYSDGVKRELTSSEFGVTVVSSDPAVAYAVRDPYLGIRCIREGEVTFVMTLGKLTDSFAFRCWDDRNR